MKLVRSLSMFLSLLLTVSAALAVPAHFANPVFYNSGGKGTNFVIAADVNLDGFPDMIVANSDGVSVLLNNGDGTFAPAVTYGTGGDIAFAVAAADLNGDGIPDLVVTNMCSSAPGCTNGGVGVLFGNGDGTFQTAVSYSVGGIETQAVVIGDFNSDGWPDLVVTSNCQIYTCVDGSIYLVLNNGDGTFKAPVSIGPSMGGPLAVGDLNGDGNLDLVADVGVLLGNGDGTFTSLGSVTGPGGVGYVPGGSISIALADVNGDGKLDVVVADQVSVKVQLGIGDGTLQLPVSFKPGGGRPLSVAAADINGDSKLDLLVANECTSLNKGACVIPGSVSVLVGNGDGTFQLPVKYPSVGRTTTSIAVMDANQDTRPDILVSNACYSSANCTHGSVGVLLNVFTAAVTVSLVSDTNPSILNQPVNFTANLTSVIPVPDGSPVNFFDGATLIGSGSTTSGVATLNTSFTTNGIHTIKAGFPGDTWHTGGSATLSQTVHRYPTTTTLTSSPNPSIFKHKVTLTATVSPSGPSAPTGTVTFKIGNGVLGTVALSGGTATLSTPNLPRGTLNLTANYNGDSQSGLSTGATSQVVQ